LGAGGGAEAEVADAADEAVASDATKGTATTGETRFTQLGRLAHKLFYNTLNDSWRTEFDLGSAGRADAVNFKAREVVELKPNNPAAIRQGLKQLARYGKALEEVSPGKTPFTQTLLVYTREGLMVYVGGG
jgi:hypothetical protein